MFALSSLRCASGLGTVCGALQAAVRPTSLASAVCHRIWSNGPVAAVRPLGVHTCRPMPGMASIPMFRGVTSFSTSPLSASPLKQFDPPGGLQEFDAKQRADWSNWISAQMDQAIVGYPDYFTNDGPRDQFYNPMKTEPAADGTALKISWIGFPRRVLVTNPVDEKRWKIADASRQVQDEYCEWNVVRNTAGKIVRVVFTCEGPEYWDFIAKYNPDLLLKLYRQYVGPQVQMADLFSSVPQEDDEFQPNKYVRANKWNNGTTGGIMHLIQPNNSLGAEIELAGGSSVVRKIEGEILEDQRRLIDCGAYGQPERNSDPFIGAQVNSLTRQKAFVTLTNPVGLYFDTFAPDGWETPDGSDPASYWKIVRGNADTPVRAVYEVPSDKSFTVGDIKVVGKKIVYGAQIADFVRIKLTGYAQNFGTSTSEPLTGCRKRKPQLTGLSHKISALIHRHTRAS